MLNAYHITNLKNDYDFLFGMWLFGGTGSAE